MNDLLRFKGLIPIIGPYTTLGYVHVGGGGEMIGVGVLAVTGANAIIDWVFIELRDKINSSLILATRCALIQADGDIVDMNGTSAVTFPNLVTDDYYIVIRHRNHLEVRSLSPVPLSQITATSYNFTTGLTQAFGANPMPLLNTGVYGMFGGNANGNTAVRATGPPTINDYTNILNVLGTPTSIQNNVYNSQDLNMDGILRVTGPPTLNDYTRLLNILGTPTTIITQPF